MRLLFDKFKITLSFWFKGVSLPRPEQHLSLGNSHSEKSLMTFQVTSFYLIWRSFYNQSSRFYADMEGDPFREWVESVDDVLKFNILVKNCYLFMEKCP